MAELFSCDLEVENIRPTLHPRTIKESLIADLAESIRVNGLLGPILVGKNNQLIFGQRRLLAVKQLGWKTIPARVGDLDNGEAELATLDENLMREDFTEVERVQAVARRKVLYLAINPETSHGGNRKSIDRNDLSSGQNVHLKSFADDTAHKTGMSARQVRRDGAIGERLDPQAAAIVAEIPAVADSKTELKALSELPPEQQRTVAKAVAAGKAPSVRAAVKAAEPATPAPETVEGRMAAANSELESFARKITVLIKEAEAIVNPHLSDSKHGRLATLVAQLRSAAGTVRAAKGAGECRYCGGVGCVRCLKTGWLTRTSLESAPEEKAA